jgi:drug/metabolite transporter (DMT)-like permease
MTDEPIPVEPRTQPGLAPNVAGALWMLASALLFTVMMTLIKYLGGDYSAALQTFYRQLAGFGVLLPLILKRRSAAFATTRPGILFFRSSAGTIGLILSFYAFQKLPLADANALSFTRTLWLVPLAAFVLREKVGPLRVAAALVGFAGVLLMVRPGSAGGLRHRPAGPGHAGLLPAVRAHHHRHEGDDPRPLAHRAAGLGGDAGPVFCDPGALLTWRWPSPLTSACSA